MVSVAAHCTDTCLRHVQPAFGQSGLEAWVELCYSRLACCDGAEAFHKVGSSIAIQICIVQSLHGTQQRLKVGSRHGSQAPARQ